MLQLKTQLLLAGALALVCAIPAAAQQTPAPAAPAEPDFVTHTSFRNRVFEVKHRDPNTLAVALRALGSGHRGATIMPSRDFMTLTVRDFPENIATIEEALRRLDVPEAPQQNIELRIHVLVAANTEMAASPIPNDLRDVIRQLESTLNYRSYRLLSSLTQRARENSRNLRGEGVFEMPRPDDTTSPARYGYMIETISLASSTGGSPSLQLRGFSFNIENTNIRTDVSLSDGERVVVGTAGLRDNRALVLILTARVVR